MVGRIAKIVSAAALIIVGLWPALVWAAPTARLEVAKTLQVGQSTELRLVIVDGSTDGVPAVPATSHLNLTYRGQSQSFVSRNFSTERSVTHLFSVLATKEGSATVGPVTLQLSGGAVVAPAVTVNIAARTVSPDGQGNALSASIDGQSDVSLWEGQALVYTLNFRHTEQVAEVNWTPPDFSGFIESSVVSPSQKDYTISEDGKSVGIVELAVPLIASGVGLREVPPAVFTVKHPSARSSRGGWPSIFGGVAGRYRTESVPSNTVTVNIRPLPSVDRPDDFSGAVGRFSVKAALSEARLALGETTTLTVVVEGEGALQGIQLPAFPEDLAVRAYDDTPNVTSAIQDGQYRSRVVFKRALVPGEEGVVQLPAVSFNWYDPVTASYVERVVDIDDVFVEPGEASDLQVQSFRAGDESLGPSDIESLGEDILPLHTELDLGNQTLRASDPLPWLMVGIPFLGFAGLLVLGPSTRTADPRAERIQALRGALREAGPDKDVALIEPLFREAVVLRGNAQPAAVDRAFIESHLLDDAAKEGVEWYALLEQARFGGGQLTARQRVALLDWIVNVAKGLKA